MQIPNTLPRVSLRDLLTSIGPFALVFVLFVAAMLHFVHPAPPTTLSISAGPEGSAYRRVADRYQKILARSGIKLRVLPSEGSLDNLQRLVDPKTGIDVGFVQGGLASTVDTTHLVSLGSLFHEPLYVFYRARAPMRLLSELRGQRVAVGSEHSGAHALALAILKGNGLEPKDVALRSDLGAGEAAQALREGRVDAIFLTNDSAAPEDIRGLLKADGIRLYDFAGQADGYVRHFRFLDRLDLSPGSFDLGQNIPPAALTMLAATVELVARDDLHPALSDLLLEAAREVHGRAGLMHAAGEFPKPLEHEYPISEDANRFYKSGKSFSYRHLPFWLASLVDRIVVVLIPAVIVLVPALRLIPALYSWRVRRRIHRRYADLMALERATLHATTDEQREPLRARLEEIENSVINIKIPAAFADQVYVLREHITFVRERLGGPHPPGAAA
jgi:TRAP transporter TAXI family solute receptor